jgi:hypothetical protein
VTNLKDSRKRLLCEVEGELTVRACRSKGCHEPRDVPVIERDSCVRIASQSA